MDMLSQGKNMVIVLAICLTSCQNNNQNKIERNYYEGLFYNKSVEVATKEVYNNVYKNANDSIKHWVDSNLSAYLGEKLFSWKIDSLICFNSQVNKCIMTLPVRCTFWKDCVQDELKYLYGVKMNKKWYFFKGPSIVLPREMYQENVNTPLSFEKLHEIAMKQIYSGYLKPKMLGLGGYEINEDFFRDLTSVAWYTGATPQTQEEWDKIYLKIVQENWAKKDTTVYRPDQ